MKPRKFSLHEYTQSGCMQFEAPELGFALFNITNGVMCEGCPAFHNGRCPSFQKMIATHPLTTQPAAEPVETVRQEAARRGLSISEVRRQRRSRI